MAFTDFVSRVRSEGLAKANRFKVLIATPPGLISSNSDLERLALYAEVSTLPGVSIETQRLKIYGPTSPRPIGIDYGSSIDITFLVDRAFNIRRLFDDWAHLVVNKDSYNVSYQSDYASDNIVLTQIDQADTAIYRYKLIGAFPVVVAPMNVGYAEEGIHRLTVTFAYRNWEGLQLETPNTPLDAEVFKRVTSTNQTESIQVNGASTLYKDANKVNAYNSTSNDQYAYSVGRGATGEF